MYNYDEFKPGFVFAYQGSTYRETDFPTNNGNFHAVNDRGSSSIFNAADVIHDSKYSYSGKTADGRKRCRICGTEIINGGNGCAMLEICFDCNGGTPKYNYKPRPLPTTFEELEASEARALSINSIYD